MVETINGTARSAGVTYQQLLDQDSHPVPDIMRRESPMPPGPTIVPAERYYSKEFHDLEVERLWSRVWQMACHEDDIPEVGDYHVYEIARLSFLIVRTGEDEFAAFHNACLHRGRMLKVKDGRRAREFRCPFHGWAWNLDGSLKEVPCQWDFPTVSAATHSLPAVRVGRWGGFIFINPDRNAEPLESFLGDLSDQFPSLPYEKRYKVAHVAKVLRCNWKVAQEAFSEAYHVIATHP
ncbi:MAG: aromatic ring-hydroxylating dioxygenase subunit alpha, partial [Pseudomonadales bacterium]